MNVGLNSRTNAGSCQGCSTGAPVVVVIALEGTVIRLCPACACQLITELTWIVRPPVQQPVRCAMCGHDCDPATAHRFRDRWIGDECCWDVRIRESG